MALNHAAAEEREICVMQFNVWQEGTSVPGGFEAMADEIARQAPDIVTLSEVRNYHGTRFCDRIVEALAKRGLTYHSFYSTDTGLLSRTEITDSAVVFPYLDDHGTVHKLVTEIDGHRVAAYTAHLDYLDDTYYEVRGYDGNSWKEIDPITDHDELMRRNLLSQRDEAARLAAADIAREREAGSLIFLGGDLNEPSGLDWTEATASTADHRGGDQMAHDRDSPRRRSGRHLPRHLSRPGRVSGLHLPVVKRDHTCQPPLMGHQGRRTRPHRLCFLCSRPAAVAPVGRHRRAAARHNPRRACGHRLGPARHHRPVDVWPSDHRAVVARFSLAK